MKALFVSLTFAALCHAQGFDGIHAPVSRSVHIPADEASFNLTVTAKLDSTAKQVKEALQSTGAPNPTVVATGLGQTPIRVLDTAADVLYSATFTLPAASAAGVAKALADLSTHPPAPLTSMQLSVTYRAGDARVEALRRTLLPEMRDEAQKTAEGLAAASGVRLGALRAVNDTAGGAYRVARIGNFSAISGFVTSVPPTIPYTFRLELVFDALQ